MPASKRLIVKIGSSLLANPDHLTPRFAFIHGLLSDVAALRRDGWEVIVASSGSVALGMRALVDDGAVAGARPPCERSVQDKQAAAACGQPILLNAYKQVALEYGFDIAQVLVTLDDLEDRKRFLNTKNTVHRLLDRGLTPIVNENDTVTTEELKVGDNDRLAAKVAQMVEAETLVILTGIDGLYDRPPGTEGARLVEEVDDVSAYLDVTTGTSSLGTGGMLTKLQAANMAQNAGCTTLIGRGTEERPITSLLAGERRHTRCRAKERPDSTRAVWLTDRLQMAGSVVLRQAAADALRTGEAGVLCTDVLSLQGDFQRGDVVHVYDETGAERARGLSNFSAEEAGLVARNPDRPLGELLGFNAAPRLVNPRNLVVLEAHHLPWDAPDEGLRIRAA